MQICLKKKYEIMTIIGACSAPLLIPLVYQILLSRAVQVCSIHIASFQLQVMGICLTAYGLSMHTANLPAPQA